jgi:hypothetical protein
MKIFKISADNFKFHKAPYAYETDPITEYMVRLPASRHWRRVYFYSSAKINSKYIGKTLRLGSGDDFSFNESFFYVRAAGKGSNFIPVELSFDIFKARKK